MGALIQEGCGGGGVAWSVGVTAKFPLDPASGRSPMTAKQWPNVVYSTHCLLFYTFTLTLFERSGKGLKTPAITISCRKQQPALFPAGPASSKGCERSRWWYMSWAANYDMISGRIS